VGRAIHEYKIPAKKVIEISNITRKFTKSSVLKHVHCRQTTKFHALISQYIVVVDEKAQLFEKKALPSPEHRQAQSSMISMLAEQLHTSASLAENPFLEYAKFDGKVRSLFCDNILTGFM